MATRHLKNLLGAAFLLSLPVLASSCSMINEDLEPCTTRVLMRFTDDYNLLYADAFANEVTSVNVYAFNEQGELVWSDSRAGESLKQKDFAIPVDLPDGTYDFIAWGGLRDNDGFSLAASDIRTKEDLNMLLNTSPAARAEENVSCRRNLPLLFHAETDGFTISRTEAEEREISVVMPLMQDVHSFTVMLNNLKGHVMNPDDFEVSISTANALLRYNNSLLPSPTVDYLALNPQGVETMMPDGNGGFTNGKITAARFDFFTSRIFYGTPVWLTVKARSDGHTVIHTEISSYLLASRGDRYLNMVPQEYFDRQRDFSLLFFLDEHNDWQMSSGIYINQWRVVPTQNGELGQ